MTRTENQLQAALDRHQAGDLEDAEALYDEILEANPDHPEATHLKGVLLRDLGRVAPAIDTLTRAVELDPRSPVARFNLAGALAAAGQPDAAEDAYGEALRLAPDFVEAHAALGALLRGQGRTAEARQACERAVALAPDMAEAHLGLGLALFAEGNYPGAAGRFAEAARLDPTNPEPCLFEAEAHRLVGDATAAITACEEAVRRAPDLAEVHFTLGNARLTALDHAGAISAYERATALDPEHVGAHCNLGNAYRDLRRVVEAGECYRRAIELAPEMAEAHSNLGITLKDRGRMDETVAAFRKALALDPDLAEARSNLLFCLCFKEDEPLDEVYREHLEFDRQHAAPLRPLIEPHANTPDPDRRLKIAYLSPDFRIHPGGHYNLPVVEGLDRENFEVTCYYTYTKVDAWTEKFRAAADRWHEVAAWDDERLAAQIRADGIDILVECAGHMAGNRLLALARKPAPIQIAHQLYPNTTGLSTIDYRLMDDHIAPAGAEAYHCEKIIRLPRAHVCYRPLEDDSAPAPEPPSQKRGYVTFGSFNNIIKLGRESVEAWSEILLALPDARLTMKWLELDQGNPEWWLEDFAQRGVADRIDLVGWSESPYAPDREIDICLDPLFATGGTTTCDALWMGVPVITKVGERPFARVGRCHLASLGLTELITETAADYVRTAVELAGNPKRLSELRNGLREHFQASPIMDEAGYVTNLENAFRTVWQDWCRSRTD